MIVRTVATTRFSSDDPPFWQGSLSDIKTWTYALTPDQVTALYRQIS